MMLYRTLHLWGLGFDFVRWIPYKIKGKQLIFWGSDPHDIVRETAMEILNIRVSEYTNRIEQIF